MALLNKDMIHSEGCARAFGRMFWAFLFFFDFRLGSSGVLVDVIPDFIGWILMASALGWILGLHTEIPKIRTLTYWMIFLSIFDLVDIQIPINRVRQIPCWTAPVLFLGLITLVLKLIVIWRLCGVIVDMAAAVNEPLIRERADFRRKLYLGFSILFLAVSRICIFFPPLAIPLFVVGLPFSIAVICLMMGLMKGTANMCRQGGQEYGPPPQPDSSVPPTPLKAPPAQEAINT
ncbi:MAG: hypothetical protein ACYTEQ_28305 [Planctomycetota bacterium]